MFGGECIRLSLPFEKPWGLVSGIAWFLEAK
jgi:hypothetical protein